MYKASFEPVKEKLHETVSQWLNWTLLSNKLNLYSQHIKGYSNIIADSLSSDFYISYESLTNISMPILPPQKAA